MHESRLATHLKVLTALFVFLALGAVALTVRWNRAIEDQEKLIGKVNRFGAQLARKHINTEGAP